MFVVDRQHNIRKGFIQHDRWRFEKAKAKIVKNSFLESFALGVKNIFLPDFFNIEYTGIESNAYQFAEVIVDKALENKSGLFLKRDISVTGVEFVPESIATTEEGYKVLLDKEVSLQLVIANEGNVEETEVLILILVTDEFGETVFEKRTKLNTIGPFESKSYYTEPLKIEKGIVYEWFILVEETENEEDFEDNIYSVKAFIPPED